MHGMANGGSILKCHPEEHEAECAAQQGGVLPISSHDDGASAVVATTAQALVRISLTALEHCAEGWV